MEMQNLKIPRHAHQAIAQTISVSAATRPSTISADMSKIAVMKMSQEGKRVPEVVEADLSESG